jgi:hypothetical protein
LLTPLILVTIHGTGGRDLPQRRNAAASSLSTPKHGIRHTFGISLWRRLHLKLTPRRRGNRTIRRAIGDALECVGNAARFKCNLVGATRPLQHNDPFSAEV